MNSDDPELPAKRLLCRRARRELAELNGGRFPHRLSEWRAIGARFGIDWHAIGGLPSVVLYYDDDAGAGDLFLPISRSRRQVHAWLIHEAVEFLCDREVGTPFHYPSWWGGAHDVAKIVDMLGADGYQEVRR